MPAGACADDRRTLRHLHAHVYEIRQIDAERVEHDRHADRRRRADNRRAGGD
jgi:hypothetical protein